MARILVIEDDPTQRILISAVFRGAGYDVIEAEDGEAGFKTADDTMPDLIVCDVVMPGLNGYEFVEALKKDPDLCFIPVIMLSALSERSHVRVGMTAGADDYLFKPVRAAELRHAATALLAKRESQKAVSALVAEYKTNHALERQQEALADRYELRLAQELNKRWTEQGNVTQDVSLKRATVLLVNAFEWVAHGITPAADRGHAMRRIFQAASDSLFLFGTQHLLLLGDDLLAIFPLTDTPERSHPASRALRAAFSMQTLLKAAFQALPTPAEPGLAALPAVSISLHIGVIELIHLEDPLHGGQHFVTAAGPALEAVKALNLNARACGWKVSASSDFMPAVTDLAFKGRQLTLGAGLTHPSLDAVEVLQRLDAS